MRPGRRPWARVDSLAGKVGAAPPPAQQICWYAETLPSRLLAVRRELIEQIGRAAMFWALARRNSPAQ